MNKITRHSLPGGMEAVHLHIPGAPVSHFGIAVRAGSSDEQDDLQPGLAHFVEHTLFKGTHKRSSWHIINRMESIGGELNAFTTKEDTVVYTSFPRGALSRAVDLVVDLVLNSIFPTKEIEREREVICEEINSYRDSPSEAVYDDFEDILYSGTPLGHNILGTLQSVRSITSEMCKDWLKTHYIASKMVVFYAGATSFDNFIKKSTPFLSQIPLGEPARTTFGTFSAKTPHFTVCSSVDTHQAHTVMGLSLSALNKKEKVTMALLTNILGGPGMNSLLNMSLREKRGLVYNVESVLTNWQNSQAMFTTYFGTDAHDTEKCVDLVEGEIKKSPTAFLTTGALKRLRNNIAAN